MNIFSSIISGLIKIIFLKITGPVFEETHIRHCSLNPFPHTPNLQPMILKWPGKKGKILNNVQNIVLKGEVNHYDFKLKRCILESWKHYGKRRNCSFCHDVFATRLLQSCPKTWERFKTVPQCDFIVSVVGLHPSVFQT